jgi:predicted Ser/Thr protein kinase
MATTKSVYRICHSIAQGGFGEVYLGVNEQTKEQVAIKVETRTNSGLSTEAKIMRILAG